MLHSTGTIQNYGTENGGMRRRSKAESGRFKLNGQACSLLIWGQSGLRGHEFSTCGVPGVGGKQSKSNCHGCIFDAVCLFREKVRVKPPILGLPQKTSPTWPCGRPTTRSVDLPLPCLLSSRIFVPSSGRSWNVARASVVNVRHNLSTKHQEVVHIASFSGQCSTNL